MATNPTEKNKEQADNKDAAVKPDQETLHTTDPQEHMEGPVSSLMQGTGEGLDTDEDEKDDDA
jgi:hypothetical protein